MVAKTDAAQHSLMAQLKARRIKKTYLALAWGAWRRSSGGSRRRSVAIPGIGRGWRSCPTAGRRSPATASGSACPGWTLLELDLVTGRTHQIRVHLDAIGTRGSDPVYGTGTSAADPMALSGCSSTRCVWSWHLRRWAAPAGRAPLPADLRPFSIDSVVKPPARPAGQRS